MKKGFYAIDLFNELAILEVHKDKDQTSFEIEFQSEDDSELKEFFRLYAVEFNFWDEIINTKHVQYLGKA